MRRITIISLFLASLAVAEMASKEAIANREAMRREAIQIDSVASDMDRRAHDMHVQAEAIWKAADRAYVRDLHLSPGDSVRDDGTIVRKHP